jgi:ABC-type iron transport system FetAB ATPase subunit
MISVTLIGLKANLTWNKDSTIVDTGNSGCETDVLVQVLYKLLSIGTTHMMLSGE